MDAVSRTKHWSPNRLALARPRALGLAAGGWGGWRAGLLLVGLVVVLGGDTARRGPPAVQLQGYHEVTDHVTLIVQAAEAQGLPPISLAAGIMNQGNSSLRPLGIDLLERAQLSLPFETPFTGPNSSVGIAQLTPAEMPVYLPGCTAECLFSPDGPIQGLATKIANANELLPANLPPTDRLMVLALAQNTGRGAAEAYLRAGGDWAAVYASGSVGVEPSWQGNLYLYRNDQLAKILANVRYLRWQGWALPAGVDLTYWQRVVDRQGRGVG